MRFEGIIPPAITPFHGRGNSLQAHDRYTETKTIWVKLGDEQIDSSAD